MIGKVTEIMNKLLKEGIFPIKWKARLVLIPKGKQDEAELPKAKPICLMDDIGKYLESIIVDRIETWMDFMYEKRCAFRAIGKNQFGFRKNMSTIDALDKVRDTVEVARKIGDTLVMICLDIENAFNSISWVEIRRMLKKRMVPKYLIRMLNSYFKDRYIEYVTRNGSMARMEVQRGVPQGSVLGPLVWIMVYDTVLKAKKEVGCDVIGYADTVIISIVTTYEEAKLNACIQAERMIHEIRKLGLRVPVEKTEVCVFQEKKGKRPPKEDVITIDGKEIKVGKKLKYLGVILDTRMDFKEHFKYVQEKAEKVKRALCKLMPNIRGPHESKKRLYAHVVQSVVMYGAPI